MNDGKFKISLVNKENGTDEPLPPGTKLALMKMSNGELIPDDEPVFILRGRDYLARGVLRDYIKMSAEDGCNEYHIDGLNAAVERFDEFAEKHPDRMKQPGCTRGF